MRSRGAVPEHAGETWNDWFSERYIPAHAALGHNVAEFQGSWNRYVAEFIGEKPLHGVTSADVKAIRDNLTRGRTAGQISAKRAMNVWAAIVKTPLSRAFTDDDPRYPGVRVGPARENPALDVKPPVNLEEQEEDERERQALEPSDFLRLVRCEAIPVERRRTYAIKAYTGLRPGELYALTWADVRDSAERPVLKILRARDMKTGATSDTKTRQSRREVPIHPALRPLLRAMRAEREAVVGREGLATAHVIHVAGRARSVEKLPGLLREDLALAGIDKPELVEGDESVRRFDERSWRTTFATWCAKCGYDSTWVDAWLGHKPKTMAARHYVKDTPHFEDVTLKRGVGGAVQPFPDLPADLLGGLNRSNRSGIVSKSAEPLCEGRELNPYRSYPTGT